MSAKKDIFNGMERGAWIVVNVYSLVYHCSNACLSKVYAFSRGQRRMHNLSQALRSPTGSQPSGVEDHDGSAPSTSRGVKPVVWAVTYVAPCFLLSTKSSGKELGHFQEVYRKGVLETGEHEKIK